MDLPDLLDDDNDLQDDAEERESNVSILRDELSQFQDEDDQDDNDQDDDGPMTPPEIADEQPAEDLEKAGHHGRPDIDAAEHRKLWAMAATSVANLLKEFSEKPVPDLNVIKESFELTTPSEWIKRHEAAGTTTKAQKADISLEQDAVVDEMDQDFQEQDIELFYDPDATNEDLKVFLDGSDQNINLRMSIQPENTETTRRSTPTPIYLQKKTPPTNTDKVLMSARKSLAVGLNVRRSTVEDSPKTSKDKLSKASSTSIHSAPDVSDHEGVLDEARKTQDSMGKRKSSVLHILQNKSSLGGGSGLGDDDLDWDLDDGENAQDDTNRADTSDDPDAMYRVMDLDYDVSELAKSLETILDSLQIESRITERYKYKLINKFNLLVHSLMTTHDKEYEIIQHLKMKRKILTVLTNFVKAEAEMSAKLIVSEEKSDEDLGQGMVLDFHQGRKSGEAEEGGEEGKGHDQGLSIEEMNATTIRDTLLRQKNRLDVLEAIKKIHVLKLKQKEFEKTLLNLHYSKMVKPSELEKEIKDARRFVNGLQIEISALHQEMGQIQTDFRVQETAVTEEEKIVEKLELEALTKQGEVSAMQHEPIQVKKEADREAEKLEQLQDEYKNICERQLEAMDDFSTYQGKIDKLTSELNTFTREEMKLNTQKKNALREIEKIMIQIKALMTREQIMLDSAAQMNEKIQQVGKMKKKAHNEQQKIFNEASKAQRIAQRLERSIKIASEAYVNARLAYDKMRAAFDAAKPSEEDSNWQKLSLMLEREIQNIKFKLEKKLEESNIKGSMVDRLKAKLNELYDEQVSSGKDLQELIRTTVRKRREREEKSEQCIKLDGQIQRLVQDIRMRELVIQDCLRACKDLAKQVEVYEGKIIIAKLEKSAILNDVSINKEKLTETRSSLRLIEVDVKEIGQRILDLDQDMKDKKYATLNERLKRDSVKNETLRSRDKFRYHRTQKEELLLTNNTLRRELERQKQDIAKIRKQFEKALIDSNEIAIKVRERIEEICTFTDYIHTYDKILLRGASEITIRELERTKLISLADELRKHVLIVKRNQPDESNFFRKIENLRKQFYEMTERRRILEIKLNENDSPERVREIDFDLMKTKENVPALEKRLDTIEELLAFRDSVGLERTLIENHVAKIADDSLSKAVELKATYGNQIKSIIHTRKNLNMLARQIDGLICENSIAAAQAETAETMFLKFRKQLAAAQDNFARGLPPTKEIEAEWLKLQWRKEMMSRAYQKNVGFLRPIQHKEGYQIKAEKLREERRKLENPKDSILGWSFSAESTAVKLNTPCQSGIRFQNSAINPRRSTQSVSQRMSISTRNSSQKSKVLSTK